MPDWHSAAAAAASRRRLALRTVAEWVNATPQTASGVVDAVRPTTTTATLLTMLLNLDRDDTGSALAPNLLWPIALAVGYLLPPSSGITLLELGAGAPGATGPDSEVEWRPPTDTPTPEMLARTVILLPGTVPTPASGAERPTAEAERMGLVLAFSRAAKLMKPEEFFADFGVSSYVVLQPGDVSPDRHELQHACFRADRLTELARVLPTLVADAKQKAGNRELVVAAAMPKTLAVALGMGLARLGSAWFTGTHLLHWDDSRRAFVPIRTRDSQPTAAPR